MSINSAYSYMNTKEQTIQNMKNNAQSTIISLKSNITAMISSYAINEYDIFVSNEINKRDIFAIIVEDDNMGKILGQKSFISGKIKLDNGQVIDFNPTIETHQHYLDNAFYSSSTQIISAIGRKIGTISVYISDSNMKKQLTNIITNNIKNTLIISLLLIITLFFVIRLFILEPISSIIDNISESDKDGIPLKMIPYSGLKETMALSNSINKMINSIKRSQVRLKNSQNRLEYLLELSPIAVRIAKKRGKDVIFANNAYSKLLRISKNQVLHQNPKDYYANKDIYDDIIKKLDNDETIYNELVKLDIQNETIWALASYMNIEFDGEKAVIGWFYDVTKEKNNETQLFEALELQTTLFDNSGYMLIRCNKEGIIQQINKAAEKTLGYQAKELINKHTPEIFHLEEEIIQRAQEFSKELGMIIEPGFKVFVEKSNQDLPNIHEWNFVAKDGKQIPTLLEVTALKNSHNEITGYFGVAKDMTQNKMMESQSKLASMGEMIGNIAHQWRQPLSAISTIASGIRLKTEYNQLNTDELLHDMDTLNAQAQYLSKTIDDFRNFIRNSNEKSQLPIRQTIEKAISIIESSMKNHHIQLIVTIEEDFTIEGFENQLIQSLINIMNNAKDAIKENLPENQERLIFITASTSNEHNTLSIKDNGGGVKESIIHNIFEPYFTTKHQSVGTGIGLSMAYQIITEHHKAQLSVQNERYNYHDTRYTGACFTITF